MSLYLGLILTSPTILFILWLLNYVMVNYILV